MLFLSKKSIASAALSKANFKQDKSAFSSLTITAIMLLSLSLLSACGGSNDEQTPPEIVVPDTVAPIITLNGAAIIDHNYGDDYTDLGATATDNVDGSLTVVISGSVTINMISSNTIIYTATDAAGNTSSVGRTVNVADLAGPIISLNGEADIEHNYGDVYTDRGASATDNVDGSVAVVTSGDVTVDMINNYTITYTATDTTGNLSSIERTVNVADFDGPVITLKGNSTVTLGKGRVYRELGATALDNIDGEVIVSAPSGTVDYDTIGVYQLTYTATDTVGNTTTAIRAVDIVAPGPFITTWRTYGTSNGITITTNPDFATEYDYHVDWGDGTTDENLTDNYTHTYDAAGTYTVTISGSFPQPYFGGCSRKLLSVEQWGDGKLLSMYKAFLNCSSIKFYANDTPNLSLVTDMSYMFYGAQNFNQDISLWDVSSVTNMSGMFYDAHEFNQDLSTWDVRSVTNMSGMFYKARKFNQDISTWDVGSVTNMFRMFLSANAFYQDISAWDVSSVTDMSYMFRGLGAFNQDISAWDVSSVTTMAAMFYSTEFNQDISAWDVSSVTNMSRMFGNANDFNQDISAWDVSSVTNMSAMFSGTKAFNQDIGIWDVSSVTNMSWMFYDSAFNQDISAWDVSSVTSMSVMFGSVTLSIENYDALLKGWSNQTLQNGVRFSVGNSQYSPSAQAARNILTNTYNWYVTDGGATP